MATEQRRLAALRVIMRWDKAGSVVFVAGSLLGALVLGVTHGWHGAAWLLAPLIGLAAIWLALLGILIFVGLIGVFRSGDTPSDEFWAEIIGRLGHLPRV